MQLILTASDLAAMPTALRQDLLAYLATRRKRRCRRAPGDGASRARAQIYAGLAVLDRGQAVALVRNVSFGRAIEGLARYAGGICL